MPYIVFQVKNAIGSSKTIVANGNNRIEVRDQGSVLREIVNSPDATPPTGEVPVRRTTGTVIIKVPYWTIQQPPPIALPAVPGVTITTTPPPPVIVDVLDTVLLQATCTLNGSPADALTVVWSSNLDGKLGIGRSVSTDSLTVGTHTITASFTNSTTATDTETVQVINASAPPTVTISSPNDSSTFEYGAAIKCAATAEDIVDGPLSSYIKWYRNTAAGLLYEGATFDLTGLTPGQHIIRAVCNDNETPPNQGQSTVTVYVSQGTFGLNGLALQDEVVIGRQSYGGQVTQ